MKFISEARVPTDNAQRYAAQTGKHWAHNMAVETESNIVRISFPNDARGAAWPGSAVVSLVPEAGVLLCRIEASAEGQRDGLKGAVERHVNRFAFREAPLKYEWHDAQIGEE